MNGPDSGQPDAVAGRGGVSAGGTGGTLPGSGGTPSSSGGSAGGGAGGMAGPGGRASGGATPTGGIGGGPATGGMIMATGGAASGGGAPATGGTGGTGGAATGGVATGGTATGGAATGGAATGGAATGGAATGGAGAGGAAPTRLILSIDFVGGRGTTAAMAMAGSETAGARPATHWNSALGAMGTLGSLTLSDGTKSNASITWNAPVVGNATGLWTINYADKPGDVRMMNGLLDPQWSTIPTAAPTLFTVSGLPASIASGSYDVYVYAVGDVGTYMRTYQYGLGSQVETVTQNSAPPVPPPSPFPYASANNGMVGTHVVFTNTGASFSVTAQPLSGSGNIYRAPVNGVQIVWPSGS